MPKNQTQELYYRVEILIGQHWKSTSGAKHKTAAHAFAGMDWAIRVNGHKKDRIRVVEVCVTITPL